MAFKNTFIFLLTIQLFCHYPQAEAATVLEIETMGTINSNFIDTAVDNNNNAVTVYTNNGLIESRYSPGNQLWGPAVVISDAIPTKNYPVVAMDATSTALAVWRQNDGITPSVGANRMSGGGIWETPVILESGTDSFPSVAMNGSGGGVAAWVNTTLGEVHASFYSGGAWTPYQVIGTSTGNLVEVSYSANGNAAAAWNSSGDIYATTSIGQIWQPQTLLDTLGAESPNVGMDENGNALVTWTTLIGILNLKWSRFDGSTWSPAQILDTPVQYGNDLAVAPNGNAFAIWTIFSGGFQVYYSQFDGTAWSVPTLIGPGLTVSVAMDSLGNAILGWATNDVPSDLYVAYLPLGGVLESPTFIYANSGPTTISLALSSGTRTGIAAWPDSLNGTSYATFILFRPLPVPPPPPPLPPPPPFPPMPPIEITGAICNNNFVLQSDRVHIISWEPSISSTVEVYLIFRNGLLINIVPASGPFIYYNHNRKKRSSDTYIVVAVNAQGIPSQPLSITLK